MTAARIGLHVLLESGALPPRPALSICEALADRLQRTGPVAASSLVPARVYVGKNGTVDVELPDPGDEGATAGAIGALLFQMLTGAPWSTDGASRSAQLDTLRSGMSGWPGGREVAALVGDLTQPDVAGRPRLAAVRDRCLALQGRIGGVPLRPWLAEQLGSADTPAPLQGVDGRPDEFTAAYPAGVMKAALAAADNPLPGRAPAMDSMPHYVAPLRAPRGDDIDAILQDLAEVPAEELGHDDPSPKPRPKARKATIGPLYGFVIGMLVALALAFGWILLG